MSASNEQDLNVKRIWGSILAGLGSAIGAFFAGSMLSAFLLTLILAFNSRVGPVYIICGSPVIGGITAVIVGIRKGIMTYKPLAESNLRTKQPRSGWKLFLLWVLATFFGMVVGFIVGAIWELILFSAFPFFPFLILYLMMGASIGWFQWLILRSNLAISGIWVLGTSLSMLVGGFISLSFPMSEASVYVVQFFLIIGITLGVAQWIMLRRYVTQASFWILANFLGIVPGVAWVILMKTFQIEPTDEAQAYLFFLIIILQVWIFYSIITGIALTWLLREHPEKGLQPVQ